jgi:hypothetical protein
MVHITPDMAPMSIIAFGIPENSRFNLDGSFRAAGMAEATPERPVTDLNW